MDVRKILEVPLIYTSYQKLVGGYRARRLFVKNDINPKPGQKILDIGCGPGYMLEFLPKMEYTGVDIDQDYIHKAKADYGNLAKFICTPIETLVLDDFGTYDIVSAAGVLHHLNDNSCRLLFETAKKALKPNGYFISMDGCYVKNQSRLDKFFLDKDRGQFIRTKDEYLNLVKSAFDNVESKIDESYFRIPYTSIIMTCQ